jgi:hypothetical protein
MANVGSGAAADPADPGRDCPLCPRLVSLWHANRAA